jgi:hypothetical protein
MNLREFTFTILKLPFTINIFAPLKNDSVAQLVEQLTLNHRVVSSNLTGVTPEL